MQAALDHLRAQGETLNDEDIARLSPLCHGHINMSAIIPSRWQNW
nr:transposase [Escherichia coli]